MVKEWCGEGVVWSGRGWYGEERGEGEGGVVRE